jgi:hypothetical protein
LAWIPVSQASQGSPGMRDSLRRVPRARSAVLGRRAGPGRGPGPVLRAAAHAGMSAIGNGGVWLTTLAGRHPTSVHKWGSEARSGRGVPEVEWLRRGLRWDQQGGTMGRSGGWHAAGRFFGQLPSMEPPENWKKEEESGGISDLELKLD